MNETAQLDPQSPLTLDEAARVMRIGVRTLRRLIGRGEIKTIQCRRRKLIRRSAIQEFWDANES
jgi:excisionase family DNA binding protein